MSLKACKQIEAKYQHDRSRTPRYGSQLARAVATHHARDLGRKSFVSSRMKKYQNQLAIFVTALVLLFSFYQTNSLVSSHFTHIDDIGVADTLINNKLCEILDEKREKYSSIPVLKDLYKRIAADPSSCEFLNGVYSYVAVPAYWTYAPVQFFFTKISLSMLNTNSYEVIKYAGRLPSFVFYIFGVLAFVYLLASWHSPILVDTSHNAI